jgi:hypothetical protein
MFVIMIGGCPRAVVETEADAQELVNELNREYAHEHFNWIIQSTSITPEKALEMTEFHQYWYKEVPKM